MSDTTMIAPEQVKMIHTIVQRLGWLRYEYLDELKVYKTPDGRPVQSCKELTWQQAEAFLGRLESEAAKRGLWIRSTDRPDIHEPASDKQFRKIRFHSLRCALHYIDLSGTTYEDERGVVLRGEELRAWLKKRFAMGSAANGTFRLPNAIPKNILRMLYNEWINPTANKWLVEGEYKKRVVHPSRLYYNELSSDAANYLIERFKQMDAVLDMERAPIHEQHSGDDNNDFSSEEDW